ncbi:hypothetical protein [Streptomyces sp. IBSBF 2435]|uniref:hypothetical protein n=1 Tax=Streptomyces sp. IBSBF 2435 TaxID=2903531 RepID=UPI002FDBD6FF
MNRPFPRMQSDLVSYEQPYGRALPVLEVSAVGETGMPESFDAHDAAELDRVISSWSGL